MMGEYLRQQTGGNSQAVEAGEWLGKLDYMQIKPVLELENRQRARVVDATAQGGHGTHRPHPGLQDLQVDERCAGERAGRLKTET